MKQHGICRRVQQNLEGFNAISMAMPFEPTTRLYLTKCSSDKPDEMEKSGGQKLNEFMEIPIHDFITGSEVVVDLFIRLSEGKVVQVAKAKDRIDIDRLKKYEKRDVTHLLVRSKDYSKYMTRCLSVAGITFQNHDLPLATRETQLVQLASNVFGEIEHFGMTKEAFGHAKEICNTTIALCQGKTNLQELMDQFTKLNADVFSHSMAVSMVSVMIGKRLNWSHLIIEKLALGGLLHDIGKQELPKALLAKPRALMTAEEVREYESHCFRGLQILRSLPEIPDDIVSIAYEHHENALGLGYPRKIKLMYINPLARVVGLANEFCRLTMPDHQRHKPMEPRDALNNIKKVMGLPYWEDAFKALRSLFPEAEKTSA